MSRTGALLVGIISVSAPVAAPQSPASEFRAAGIPVIFKPVAENEVIAAQLYLKGGSANLGPGSAGIERFIGTVSTRGTEKYTRERHASRRRARRSPRSRPTITPL
jgi:hypothetical protein